MVKFEKQNELFGNNYIDYSSKKELQDISIDKKIIQEWQKRIINYQSKVFKNDYKNLNQYSLFESHPEGIIEKFNPLELTPLPLSFWRWPKPIHKGPAVYFVIDKTTNTDKNIILYIGETLSADKRWKGDHDCKNYLSNYSEILQKVSLISNLDIRFWFDVPENTKERRKLEQNLIQTWLPPFNKETRGIWSTPFTSQIK
tara:strand:- start:93 stop:692 length:600 start_codon:yes stop_codon:yes gene_type:complete